MKTIKMIDAAHRPWLDAADRLHIPAENTEAKRIASQWIDDDLIDQDGEFRRAGVYAEPREEGEGMLLRAVAPSGKLRQAIMRLHTAAREMDALFLIDDYLAPQGDNYSKAGHRGFISLLGPTWSWPGEMAVRSGDSLIVFDWNDAWTGVMEALPEDHPVRQSWHEHYESTFSGMGLL